MLYGLNHLKPVTQALCLTQAIMALVLLSTIAGCDQGDAAERSAQQTTLLDSSLDAIKKRGKLIVLTSNYPTTYYYDRDNQLAGPEYDMTQAFAHFLKVDVEYKVYDSTNDVITALRDHQGDIAASGLTVNDLRKSEFDFGPVYQETQEYLVCHRSYKPVNDAAALKNVEIVVAAGSSYIESLQSYPDATWKEDPEKNTSVLLAEVAQKKIACTVSDSTLFDIERRYHTELQKKFTLAKGSKLAWMLNKNNAQLKQSMEKWFQSYSKKGDLSQVLDKYYGFVEIFDYVDTHKFLGRVKTRLPKYKEYFEDAAARNGIEPSLLAAQSYQESHWNPKAKSPTGVRGIMMLTQPVAESLGVTSRLDAKQNIYAGAEFHARMRKMVEHVDEPDRTWLTLAAYNVGRGHFRDAQSLAKQLNKDPDRWSDMKQVLPLLSEKKYHKDLRYGYARGDEPVQYVERIRSYEELLLQHFSRKDTQTAQNNHRP
jgi:membrane-bound lytic murein transglycosylase F